MSVQQTDTTNSMCVVVSSEKEQVKNHNLYLHTNYLHIGMAMLWYFILLVFIGPVQGVGKNVVHDALVATALVVGAVAATCLKGV